MFVTSITASISRSVAKPSRDGIVSLSIISLEDVIIEPLDAVKKAGEMPSDSYTVFPNEKRRLEGFRRATAYFRVMPSATQSQKY